ncbi:MAG: glycosyltransferase family 2 protein [Deltaproteobacteria bacterium]|nr:glycosyltransferase family 2 protein [Deltaproteobacteria bacterium]
MEKLSVTIITLNEEDNIRDALESVKWAHEIIVVDSGSTDSTVDICREYTDKVIYNPWPGMNGQKAFAKEQASCGWLLNIDADERVSPELEVKIKTMLEKGPEYDGYFIPRRVWYLGSWIDHSGWYPDYTLRLFKRDRGRWAGTDPHDKVVVEGTTSRLKEDIHHFTYKNVTDHINTMNRFTAVAAGEYEKKGKRAGFFNLVLRPPFTFFKKYILKQGFRDGLPGFVIAFSSAYYVFLKYVKLWELKNIERVKETGK